MSITEFQILKNIALLGGAPVFISLIIIITLILLFNKRDKHIALFVFFNYLFTMIIVGGLKFVTHKVRNPLALVKEDTYAFPSWHVAVAMTSFLVLFYFSRFVKEKWLKFCMRLIAFIWLFIIIADRLLLGVHDLQDVIGGIVISVFIFLILLRQKYFNERILKREFKN